MQAEAIEAIRDSLVLHRPTYFADCVKWARLRFEDLFHNSIMQLLFNFPPHQVPRVCLLCV
jgi:ubiquitin-activating enzyme E1